MAGRIPLATVTNDTVDELFAEVAVNDNGGDNPDNDYVVRDSNQNVVFRYDEIAGAWTLEGVDLDAGGNDISNVGSISTDGLYTDSRLYDAVVWTDGSTYYADGRASEIASGSSFSTVFQAALDLAVTSNRDNGTVAVAKGTFEVDATVDVREGVTVEASQGAIFEPASDIDMFRARPDAAWHGGAINARNGVGFTSDVFLHEGTSSGDVLHGPRNQTTITDVFIALRDTSGIGVALRPLDENANHVTWTYHDRIAVYGGQYAFTLSVPATTGYTTPPYANANYFSNCETFQSVESFHIDAPDESDADGNSFEACAAQANGDSTRAVNVNAGNNNQFTNMMIWDWNIAGTSTAVDFAADTELNRFGGYVNRTYVSNGGANSVNGISSAGGAPSSTAKWQGQEDVAEELGVLIWDTSTSPATAYRAFNGSYIALN